MPVQVLASARAGLEATRGTAVTPTRLVYFRPGGASHNQDVGAIIPQESWASYTPNRRAYAGLQRNGLSFSGDFTYTDAIFWLNLAIDAEASGALTDTTAYTWTFLPVHTSDALKSATFEYAYADLLSVVGWRLPGCIVNRLAVTWTKAVGGAETGVSFEADLMTASGATQITAFTGSLTDRAIASALGNNTLTYLNSTASAFGATADTRINQATWEVTNGYVYRDGFDGTSTAMEIIRSGQRQSRVTMQRYFNDKTELDAYIAKTTRRLRVKSEGALVGAVSALNTLQLDFAGVPEVHNVAESDGLIYANIELAPLEDSSLASDFKWTVINGSASIT